MFIRDIKVKSNNQIKTSEKKGFIKEILKQFPKLNEDDLKNLIKIKESEIILIKAVTHDSYDVVIYMIDKIPYFFRNDKEEQLIPTVYFLWKHPNILPKFYTYKEVISKLTNGADFMLPGLITEGEVNLYTFKHIDKNDLISLCIKGNEAPVAIGKSFRSGEEMYMSAMKGKGLIILNIYTDNLWAMGDKSDLPLVAPIVISSTNISDPSEVANEKSTNEALIIDSLNLNDPENSKSNETSSATSILDQDLETEKPNQIDHQKVLEESFLCAIKFKSKEFKLPIIVSTFVKIMQTCCPSGVQFDLKQTRFKKISMFLKEMEMKGCIKTKELQKGVLSITDIQRENEIIKYFKRPDWFKALDEIQMNEQQEDKYLFEIIEMFKVDGNTEPFFKKKFKKGDVLSSSEIRQYAMNYIKENQLQLPDNQRYFKPDDILTKIFLKNKPIEKLTFEDFFAFTFTILSPMHQIKKIFSDKKEINYTLKGKFQPVEFKMENRGGNKRVTCVYNLSAFELDIEMLQSRIKNKLGCSVTVVEQVAASADQNYIICIQGNQIYPVSEILKSEFGIQLKYMQGLELGIKNK